jgi:hypothetical protein
VSSGWAKIFQPISKLFFFFFSTGVWTQGLYLEPLHQLILCVCLCVCVSVCMCAGFFQGTVWQTNCLGWLWMEILLISASRVARITGVSYWHWAVFCFFETSSHYVAQTDFELPKSSCLGLLSAQITGVQPPCPAKAWFLTTVLHTSKMNGHS